MYKKIDIFVNGIYQFSTKRYKTQKDIIRHIRAVKHIEIASVPTPQYLTVYDYDRITARYSK